MSTTQDHTVTAAPTTAAARRPWLPGIDAAYLSLGAGLLVLSLAGLGVAALTSASDTHGLMYAALGITGLTLCLATLLVAPRIPDGLGLAECLVLAAALGVLAAYELSSSTAHLVLIVGLAALALHAARYRPWAIQSDRGDRAV